MRKRLSLRNARYISTFGPVASIVALICRWVYMHYTEQDFYLDITNFAVVLLPFAFSIFFAFVPDMRERHIAFRVAVLLIGIGFSWVVWKQQHLAAEAARRDQVSAIRGAVEKSNQHSDKQISGVRNDLQDSTTTLSTRLDDLFGLVKKKRVQFEQQHNQGHHPAPKICTASI